MSALISLTIAPGRFLAGQDGSQLVQRGFNPFPARFKAAKNVLQQSNATAGGAF